jgi:hypothetical protein
MGMCQLEEGCFLLVRCVQQLPTILRYRVASVGDAVLFLLSLRRLSICIADGLQSAIPCFSSILSAYAY